MSETLIAALIGAGATLMVTIITQISTVYISGLKENLKIKQNEFQAKRDNLSGVYKTLLTVINSFPNESPNDVLLNTVQIIQLKVLMLF